MIKKIFNYFATIRFELILIVEYLYYNYHTQFQFVVLTIYKLMTNDLLLLLFL